MSLLSVLLRVVAGDRTVNLVDLLNLSRNGLQDLVSQVQFGREIGLLGGDQRLLPGYIVIEDLLLIAVLREGQSDGPAQDAFVAEIVKGFGKGGSESSGVLEEGNDVVEVGIQRACQRVGRPTPDYRTKPALTRPDVSPAVRARPIPLRSPPNGARP